MQMSREALRRFAVPTPSFGFAWVVVCLSAVNVPFALTGEDLLPSSSSAVSAKGTHVECGKRNEKLLATAGCKE